MLFGVKTSENEDFPEPLQPAITSREGLSIKLWTWFRSGN